MREDKYNLTRDQSIFLAKKTIVQNVYNLAKLEGCNITFPQTQTILDGVNDPEVSLEDLQTVTNLRSAWKYVIKNIDKPLDLNFIYEIHKRISKNDSLVLETLEVLKEKKLKAKLKEFSKVKNTTERAIRFYLWSMKVKLFLDGNRSISNICANKIMIKEGKGLITTPEKKISEFNNELLVFYNTNNYSKLNKFLYDNCLCGIEIKN